MEQVVYNLRIDKDIRDQAFSVFKGLGMTPSQAIRMFLKQMADTREVPLSLKYPKELQLGTETIKSLEQGSADYQAGKLEKYSADTAIQAMQDLAHG